jgi:hypothetical protein
MALRLFFIALSVFDRSNKQLEEFVKTNFNSNTTIFDVDSKSEAREKDKTLLLSLMSLVKSTKTFSLDKHEGILKNHPHLSDVWKNHESFIKEFLKLQCQTSDLNFHGIFSSSSKKIEDQNALKMSSSTQQPIGSGSLLFGSLINHSCANNLLRICAEGRVVYVVCRPIEKGSQLFDCYK